MNNPKRVYEARNLAEAELVKGLLQSANVHSIVQEGALETVFGEMVSNAETLPSVWVNESDVQNAEKIVEEFKRGHAAAGSHWRCPRCGELLDSQFTGCWKCNTQRTQMA